MSFPATETLTRGNPTGKKINVYIGVKSKGYKYTVQCLRLHTSSAEASGSVPGWETDSTYSATKKI